MTNRLEAQIREEIKARVDRLPADLPDRGEIYYFNNFHLKLPQSGQREILADYLEDPRLACQNGRTLGQFFADVDLALQKTGIDMTKLGALMQRYREAGIRKRIFEIVFPAYVRLREMGYTHKDLVA